MLKNNDDFLFIPGKLMAIAVQHNCSSSARGVQVSGKLMIANFINSIIMCTESLVQSSRVKRDRAILPEQQSTLARSAVRNSLQRRSSTTENANFDPGNTPASGFGLRFKFNKQFIRNTAGTDDPDFFRFRLNQPRVIALRVKNFSANILTSMLYNENGVITSSEGTVHLPNPNNPLGHDAVTFLRSQADTNVFTGRLRAGEYFLRLNARDGVKNSYRLEYSFVARPKPQRGEGGTGGSSGSSSGGSCDFPWQRDSRGRRCGDRAASVRPGGR